MGSLEPTLEGLEDRGMEGEIGSWECTQGTLWELSKRLCDSDGGARADWSEKTAGASSGG